MNQATTGAVAGAITNTAGSKSFTIDFNGQASTFSFSMGLTGITYTSGSIPNKSTSLYFFNCSGTYLAQYDVAEATMTANPTSFTPVAVPNNASIPSIPSLTVTGTTCIGNTSTLTAPATATWYASHNNFTATIGSPTTVLTTTIPGIYHARLTGSCGDYWLATVVSQTSPILSRNAEVLQNCDGSTVAISVGNGGYSYAWTPTANISGPTNSYIATANSSSNTIYSVTATSNSCTTTETISLLATNSNTIAEDLWLRDDMLDDGSEPNTTYTDPQVGGVVWNSPDIWLKQTDFSIPSSTTTENGEYKESGDPNYIHVKVRNTGSVTATGKLNVYWSKGAMVIPWSSSWVNSFTTAAGPSTLILGDQIGSPITVSIGSNSAQEFVIPWQVPNPADYAVLTGTNNQHFCLLARIETGCGMLNESDPGDVCINAIENDQIATRNISIHDDNLNDRPPRGWQSWVLALNQETVTTNTKFKLVAATNSNGKTIFDHGFPYLELQEDLYDLWVEGGSLGDHVEDLGDRVIKVTANDATLENIDLTGSQLTSIGVRFTFNSQASSSYSFDVDMMQYSTESSEEILGGQHYLIAPAACPTLEVETRTVNIDLGCTATPSVINSHTNVEYTWYVNATNSLIATSISVAVSPTTNTVYRVEAAEDGCVKSETVTVVVSTETCIGGKTDQTIKTETVMPNMAETLVDEQNIKLSVKPNPSNDKATITYNIEGIEKAELMIVNSYGQLISRTWLDPKKRKFVVDCNDLSNGVYYISLITGNKITKTVKLIVMK